jgi:hypothetical protein
MSFVYPIRSIAKAYRGMLISWLFRLEASPASFVYPIRSIAKAYRGMLISGLFRLDTVSRKFRRSYSFNEKQHVGNSEIIIKKKCSQNK